MSNAPSIVPPIAEATPEERAFIERTLLALANDIALLEETTDRVVTLVRAMALQYRVPVQDVEDQVAA